MAALSLLVSTQLISSHIFALSSAALQKILIAQTYSHYKLVVASDNMMNVGAGPLYHMGIDAATVNYSTTTMIAHIGKTKTVLMIAPPRLMHYPHPTGIACTCGTLSLYTLVSA